MMPTKPLILSAAVLLTACISLPAIEEAQVDVRVATPSDTAYTNGTVEFQLEVLGTPPDIVELLVDDEPLTTLDPPYTFQWDTTSVPEGQYRLTGRVRAAGKSFTSDVREVVVDRTPPQVVSRTPTPGAQNVAVRQSIQASFSEPIRASTLTTTAVQLTLDDIAHPYALALDPDGKMLTVAPASALSAPSTATLTLSDSITDLAGNNLTPPPDLWTWQMPSWLLWGPFNGTTAPGKNDFLGGYEIDASGNVFAAWVVVESPTTELYIQKWAPDGSWEPLGGALGAHPGNTPIYFLSLILDKNKQPIVAWSESDGTSSTIQVRRWSNGSWEVLGGGLRSFPTSTSSAEPRLQLDPSGNILLAWTEVVGNAPWFCVRRWTDNEWQSLGGCIDTQNPETDLGSVLRVDSSGYPVVGWIGAAATIQGQHTYFRRWNGSMWTELGDDVSADTRPMAYPASITMELNGLGNPSTSWIEADEASGRSYVRVDLWTGTEWQSLGGRLTTTPYTTAPLGHSLLLDNPSTPILAWSRMTTSPNYQINIWRWADDTWKPISQPLTAQSSSGPRLHTDSSGQLLLSWIEHGGGATPQRLIVRRFNR